MQSREEISVKQKQGQNDQSVVWQAHHFETVLKKVEIILAGFDEAKQSIKLVGNKNSHVKSLLEQLEKDLNTLRNKSNKRH